MKKIYFIVLLSICGCQQNTEQALQSKVVTLEEQLIVAACPSNMTHISGNYCTQVLQVCKSYMESPESTPFARCLEFNKSKCTGKVIEMNFCIDTEEYSLPSDDMPLSNVSWATAKSICEQENKRLCKEPEWNFACEGEDMLPYTTGYTRPSKICNIDISKNVICKNELCDHRKSFEEDLECLSPFNVHNMSGNIDEWIEVPLYHHSKNQDLTMRSSLKGGHWLPVRNRCRPRTDDHDETFHQISIGFRCCQDTDALP